MSDDAGLTPLAPELAQSMILLRASRAFYLAMLVAVRETAHTGPRGDPDYPGLFRQMNEALVGFAPRDHEIKQLLARLAR